MSNQHPSLERRGWGWLIMRQRKSTPPSLPFLRGGISLPKNSVICAKNTRLSKLISKKSPPRTTDAFGLPLSGNIASAQRNKVPAKSAEFRADLPANRMPKFAGTRRMLYLCSAIREWSGLGEEFQARALLEKETGRENKGNRPLLRKQERRSPRDVVIWAEKLISR